MASWFDVFALLITTLLFVGFILAILYAAQAISSRLQSTKASLEQRGITLSRDGVALKTQSRFDRDDYVDATQRGFVKALSAVTVGPESRKQAFLPRSHSDATNDAPAARGNGEHAKHTVFGVAMRRSHSGGA